MVSFNEHLKDGTELILTLRRLDGWCGRLDKRVKRKIYNGNVLAMFRMRMI